MGLLVPKLEWSGYAIMPKRHVDITALSLVSWYSLLANETPMNSQMRSQLRLLTVHHPMWYQPMTHSSSATSHCVSTALLPVRITTIKVQVTEKNTRLKHTYKWHCINEQQMNYVCNCMLAGTVFAASIQVCMCVCLCKTLKYHWAEIDVTS